ncbi:5-methyltetrahydropteroyltriglutamate--homocysteine S-methyltransferase [Candidatus Berkiella cookevillensis]|uniref:5-methyltetrahydropteroyltriglutamate--homocysteine methyltransferase n=1 Tax=Candidatus Berkiella cookevillensis TaxID=437022 RepID=A0A0Q9YFF3_9GAMM|nr:5-methyltetrahydropteroyltriglutamate--homocysteine S-methyltransferase [Candidatus Berkiella cookevillensis]MCS5708851.1 5-methyltetrahydropteroyltriglutamate--homocysteine S-methyltransferase [Candidatus Berkiella cookevillensis]
MVTYAHILGFPRIGKDRELKKTVEAYWAGKIDKAALFAKAKELRAESWRLQKQAGLDFVTVGDFSFYDHILDMAAMLGVVPERFGALQADENVDIDTYFRMGRGRAPTGKDVPALEMTKWFDTNYHYIVPELNAEQNFKIASSKLFDEIEEAQQQGHNVKPVIVGPLTFLWLSKSRDEKVNKLSLLDNLITAYGQILNKLQALNIEWLQIDEPILSLELPQEWKDAFEATYTRLKQPKLKVLLATYFDTLGQNTRLVCQLPVDGIHVDLVNGANQLISVLDNLPNYKILSAGVVSGRNIWRADLSKTYETLSQIKDRIQDRLWISTSCSLLHCPVDLQQESKIPHDLKSWMAFSVQKLDEIVILAKAINQGPSSVQVCFEESDNAKLTRQQSKKIHRDAVKEKMAKVNAAMLSRKSTYQTRAKVQASALNLPLFPTTTIGSFPQTTDIRNLRKEKREGRLTEQAYTQAIQAEIKNAVKWQEEVDLDVLVHGEAERNDMVEYFGELLDGYAFTQNGWVQSYGSRCVKPPVIYGDVQRSKAMTIEWSKYAQSLTKKPMKGMLTGPVTMLCWSFVRDDQPRKDTAMQIALALRDEIVELEQNGIQIIQLDEPAFREGLPLKQSDWPMYLEWAVNVFKLATCGVKDSTQIHTHMCYSEFNDVIESIAALDADVITIETSRSQMELLEAFQAFKYPNEIGPGVYDIHSPRVPSQQEMTLLLEKAAKVIPAQRLWVNPDCGLKTRNWEETKEALIQMVNAAKTMREKLN